MTSATEYMVCCMVLTEIMELREVKKVGFGKL